MTKDISKTNVIEDALKEYPAMSKVFNKDNAQVSVADDKRLEKLKAVGGENRIMETWFPDDEGSPDFPNPTPGKFNFEFYNKDVYNDPKLRQASIMLDALHGMKQDPEYSKLRERFNQSWKDSELNWIKSKYVKESNPDESLPQYMDRTITDAYLRGALNPLSDQDLKSGKYVDEYAQLYRGQIYRNGNPVDPYSKDQRDSIEKIKTYLKTKK